MKQLFTHKTATGAVLLNGKTPKPSIQQGFFTRTTLLRFIVVLFFACIGFTSEAQVIYNHGNISISSGPYCPGTVVTFSYPGNVVRYKWEDYNSTIPSTGGNGTNHPDYYGEGNSFTIRNDLGVLGYSPDNGYIGEVFLADGTVYDFKIMASYPPTISASGGGSISCGSGITFTASGSSAGNYRWSNGATSSSITSPATPGNYSYTVTAVSSQGCTGSNTVSVSGTVYAKPTAPTLGTKTEATCAVPTGTQVINGLPASGTWTLKRGTVTVASNKTGTTYTESGIPAGTYTYTVTNSNGCVSAASASFNITSTPAAPVITTQTAVTASSICAGTQVTFTAAATGAVSYRWQVNGGGGWSDLSATPVNDGNGSYSGATTTSLIVTPSASLGWANLQWRMNAIGSGTCSTASNGVLLTVNTQPVITGTTGATTVCAGGSTTFHVDATGSNLKYQWQYNTGIGWTNETDGTFGSAGSHTGSATADFKITTGNTSWNGVQWRSIVSNGCSSAVSPAFTLAINDKPTTVTISGADASYCLNSTAPALTATTTGTAATSYQWYGAGATIGGATTQTYTPSTAFAGSTTYTVQASNSCGTSPVSGGRVVTVTVCNVKIGTSKVILQGAWNGTAMTTTLNSKNLIPAAQPYSVAPFNHTSTAAENTVTSAFFTSHTNIVDWILLELRDGTNPNTIVASRAAFVKSDGTIVDVDGTSAVDMGTSVPGNYYVAVRHRNHLGVRTRLAQTTDAAKMLSFDFTSPTADVYQNATYPVSPYNNTPEVTVTGGKLALWGGDANSNGVVRYTGPSNDQNQILNVLLSGNPATILTNQYKAGDLNLDGIVKYVGTGNDQNVLLNTVLGGNSALVFTQHL